MNLKGCKGEKGTRSWNWCGPCSREIMGKQTNNWNRCIWEPVYTTDHEVGPWKMAFVKWFEFMARLHQNLVLRALGPSLGVNRMWIKKSDHAPKYEGVNFFNTCPKRAIFEKNQVWLFSCLLLGFICLHFLLNVSKMWLTNLLTTFFTKMSD